MAQTKTINKHNTTPYEVEAVASEEEGLIWLAGPEGMRSPLELPEVIKGFAQMVLGILLKEQRGVGAWRDAHRMVCFDAVG